MYVTAQKINKRQSFWRYYHQDFSVTSGSYNDNQHENCVCTHTSSRLKPKTCRTIMTFTWNNFALKLFSLLLGVHFVISTANITGIDAHPQWRQSQETSNKYRKNYNQVSLLPFQISIEFEAISSPDILHYALMEYLLNRTSATSIILMHHDPAQNISNEYAVLPIDFKYNGSAIVSAEYGRMAQVLLQNEQRIAITDPSLESVLQNYYELVIYPYKGNIFVRGIELMEEAQDPTVPPKEFSDSVQRLTWYTIALASAGGAAACATILVILSICVITYRKYWKEHLQMWKYNAERERTVQILAEDPNEAGVANADRVTVAQDEGSRKYPKPLCHVAPIDCNHHGMV